MENGLMLPIGLVVLIIILLIVARSCEISVVKYQRSIVVGNKRVCIDVPGWGGCFPARHLIDFTWEGQNHSVSVSYKFYEKIKIGDMVTLECEERKITSFEMAEN